MENKLNFLQWVCSEYTPVISSHEGGGQGNGVIEEEAEVPGEGLGGSHHTHCIL